MQHDTGKGKARSWFLTDGGPKMLGILYNFDIDSDELKIEHEDWLDDYVIPLLQLGGNWNVVLNGRASRSGDALYNEKLSERRARSVRNYLIAYGGADLNIRVQWSGTRVAVAGHHQTEDLTDRSVDADVNSDPNGLPNPFAEIPPLFTEKQIEWQCDPMRIESDKDFPVTTIPAIRS